MHRLVAMLTVVAVLVQGAAWAAMPVVAAAPADVAHSESERPPCHGAMPEAERATTAAADICGSACGCASFCTGAGTPASLGTAALPAPFAGALPLRQALRPPHLQPPLRPPRV